MRVVVDLQAFPVSAAPPSVIDHYCASLACAMLRHAGNHDVQVLINHSSEEFLEKLQHKFPDLFGHAALCVSRLPFVDIAEADSRWHRGAAELVREHAILQLKPDVVLSAPVTKSGSVAMVSQLRCASIPTAFAFSELPPALGPGTSPEESVLNGSEPSPHAVYRKQRWQAGLVFTGSEYCKRLLLNAVDLQPERVIVVPPGVNERFRPSAVSEELANVVTARFAPGQDFIVLIAGQNGQGAERLLEAYALLPSELRAANRLALVGVSEGDQSGRLLEFARSNGLNDGELVLVGQPGDDELAALYSKCKLLVLPALEEVPVQQALDAMNCGTPVLGPDRSSVPEILGLRKALFDPLSARHISEKICQVLVSPDLRKELTVHAIEQARRFSWRASVRRSFEALEVLSRSGSAPRPRLPSPKSRPRMAYVSPLPPERSGIAGYSAELLPELVRYYEIDLITDLSQISDPILERQFRRVPLRQFESLARGYDRILYHIGNSPFHVQIPSLLEQYPGPVVLHDFFLSHLFNRLEATDQISLWRNLYVSHGYAGLIARARKGAEAALWAYPCNLAVLSHAAGIIVHSDHATQLAREWFGISTESWKIIPQLRKPSPRMDRRRARRALGISPDTFLVCSFGFLARAKLNDLLFHCWLGSSLANREDCCLVFVGGDGAGQPYPVHGGSANRIRATGYLSPEDYDRYLAAADVGVQLRGDLSRGETPRSVLDCMAYGVATIVNAHPALGDLPVDSVLKLSESCTSEELTTALERLYRDPGYRARLGRSAREHVQARRSPALIARQYAEAVEEFASDHPAAVLNRVAVNLAELGTDSGPPVEDLATVASCIAESSGASAVRQLLVDVSVLVSVGDYRTGIQRVTRAILAQLLATPPPGYRVEPVFRAHQQTYHYARRFAAKCLQLEGLNLEDAPVAVNPGDIFLGLDWDAGIAIDDRAKNWLLHHHQRGMRIVFTAYDLLPLQHAEWFEPDMPATFLAWLSAVCRVADGLACISRAVADDLINWLESHSASTRAFDIGYFHLGSDIEASWASEGLNQEDQKLLDTLKGRELILMIGTVEPRKGHSQALSAMEHLWAAGENLGLLICGKQGWMADWMAQRLRSHPELGHRLFWMEHATDEALLQLYSIASGLLMASEGEGFGLPLIEAAHHGLPIITRDLAVFREVAGEHAFYFSGSQSADLADALGRWLMLYRRGEHPKSNMIQRLTWQQSAQQLLRLALGGTEYKHSPPRRASYLDQPMHATADGRRIDVSADQGDSVDRQSHVPRRESSNGGAGTNYGAAAETQPVIASRALTEE